jgi:regulator of RNase E activity RraA
VSDAESKPQPTETTDIQRPDPSLVASLQHIGSATASGELKRLGIRSAFIQGPVAMTPGASIVGPALTLQFMPKREDLYPEDEYVDPERQLHRHVLYHAQPGDIVVVDARANLTSGVFGAMMMTYFRGRDGLGVVIDGAIRDFAEIKALGLGIWLRGVTPNFHTQTNIFPFAVNVPIACGGVTVLPGDLIIADDDGAVVVPIQYAPRLAQKAVEHVEWEEFSRLKLSEGGDLRRYYPLSDAARPEYEAWRRAQQEASAHQP